ncbi:MAG TPA: class I SAM-dependent methyltransferase [Candidatus Limnocylindrales bacterium]|nr:class I SAM-dependent methyltransferase [Candidatus Limnocylindrales bacterium]
MDHRDHVALIRDGVVGGGPRWIELGAGDGAFTLALADLLGERGEIVAVDRDPRALATLGERLAGAFPAVSVRTVAADFRAGLPPGRFDGVLAANSLHFVDDPVPVLRSAAGALAPGGRVVVVEYDADRGNPWVPHPFSAARFPELAAAAGLPAVQPLGRVPSRFLGAIWSAAAWPEPGATGNAGAAGAAGGAGEPAGTGDAGTTGEPGEPGGTGDAGTTGEPGEPVVHSAPHGDDREE